MPGIFSFTFLISFFFSCTLRYYPLSSLFSNAYITLYYPLSSSFFPTITLLRRLLQLSNTRCYPFLLAIISYIAYELLAASSSFLFSTYSSSLPFVTLITQTFYYIHLHSFPHLHSCLVSPLSSPLFFRTLLYIYIFLLVTTSISFFLLSFYPAVPLGTSPVYPFHPSHPFRPTPSYLSYLVPLIPHP